MFGISLSEFLIILLVAIAVIPAKDWPSVARFLAKVVKYVREIVWKITDAAEEIREQIDLEKPVAELTQKTMEDMKSVFAEKKKRKKS
jgi:Sec-independent protein translocase protein TatA